jgi:hypothetical protein
VCKGRAAAPSRSSHTPWPPEPNSFSFNKLQAQLQEVLDKYVTLVVMCPMRFGSEPRRSFPHSVPVYPEPRRVYPARRDEGRDPRSVCPAYLAPRPPRMFDPRLSTAADHYFLTSPPHYFVLRTIRAHRNVCNTFIFMGILHSSYHTPRGTPQKRTLGESPSCFSRHCFYLLQNHTLASWYELSSMESKCYTKTPGGWGLLTTHYSLLTSSEVFRPIAPPGTWCKNQGRRGNSCAPPGV